MKRNGREAVVHTIMNGYRTIVEPSARWYPYCHDAASDDLKWWKVYRDNRLFYERTGTLEEIVEAVNWLNDVKGVE